MANVAASIDVELFISEIKKYPEIWDSNSEDNRYKNRRQHAWTEIIRTFCGDIEDLPEREKLEILKKIQCKWRNLRDNYVRNKKRSFSKKGYLYAKHLSFLEDQYKNQSGSDIDGDNHDNDETWSDDTENLKKILFETKQDSWRSNSEDETSSLSLKRKRSTQIEFVETNMEPTSCYLPVDDDKSFFESLLPVVRLFDVDQKLEFRSDVIRLIKHIRSGPSRCIKDESD